MKIKIAQIRHKEGNFEDVNHRTQTLMEIARLMDSETGRGHIHEGEVLPPHLLILISFFQEISSRRPYIFQKKYTMQHAKELLLVLWL